MNGFAVVARRKGKREIVRTVLVRYCRALDTKNWDLLGEVFLPDATANLSGKSDLVGVDAITSRIKVALEHLDGSQHLVVGNHEVSVDGDKATHQCYLYAQHISAHLPSVEVVGRTTSLLGDTSIKWSAQKMVGGLTTVLSKSCGLTPTSQ